MANFSFNVIVLTSRAFSKCFCSIFYSSFSQLLSNFDLCNPSILESKATSSALFLVSSPSSKMFCSSSSNGHSNKSNFLFVRSWASCAINFTCSAVFLRSLTEIYEVSDNALEKGRLGKFFFCSHTLISIL